MVLLSSPTPTQWWQRCQHKKGDNFSATGATTPAQAQQWQQCQCIEGNYASATIAMMPVWWRRWHQRTKGKKLRNGNITITKTGTIPVQQSGWQHQCNDVMAPAQNGNDVSTTMAMMPEQQGGQCRHNNGKSTCATMATAQLQSWQRGQCNNSNDTIATTAKKQAQQFSSTTNCKVLHIVVISALSSSLPGLLSPYPSSSNSHHSLCCLLCRLPHSFSYGWSLCVR